jgi:hypothetical protein
MASERESRKPRGLQCAFYSNQWLNFASITMTYTQKGVKLVCGS